MMNHIKQDVLWALLATVWTRFLWDNHPRAASGFSCETFDTFIQITSPCINIFNLYKKIILKAVST